MIEELLKLRKQLIQMKMIDICSDIKYHSKKNKKKNKESRKQKYSYEISNYQLVKKKEGRK